MGALGSYESQFTPTTYVGMSLPLAGAVMSTCIMCMMTIRVQREGKEVLSGHISNLIRHTRSCHLNKWRYTRALISGYLLRASASCR